MSAYHGFEEKNSRKKTQVFMFYVFFQNWKGDQWGIQDIPERHINSQSGCANLLFCVFLAENTMKMKEFGPPMEMSS